MSRLGQEWKAEIKEREIHSEGKALRVSMERNTVPRGVILLTVSIFFN